MRAVLAMLATLVVPGYGQASVGRTRSAIAWAAVVPLAMLGVFASMWMFYVAMLLRVASGVHAAVVSRKQTAFDWTATPAIAVAIAGLVSFTAIRTYVLEGYRMPTSSMYPTLVIGDHVFVDRVSPHVHDVERGDVIVFAFPCNPRIDYVKRVIALGGDTVEVRCGALYVNGTPVPTSLVAASCTYKDYDESNARWVDRSCSRYRETLAGTSFDTFQAAGHPTRHELAETHDFPDRDKRVLPSCGNASESLGQGPPPIGKLVETAPRDTAKTCEPQYHYVVPTGTLFVMGDNRVNSSDSRHWGPVATSALRGRVLGIWLTDGVDGVVWSRVGGL